MQHRRRNASDGEHVAVVSRTRCAGNVVACWCGQCSSVGSCDDLPGSAVRGGDVVEDGDMMLCRRMLNYVNGNSKSPYDDGAGGSSL